MNASPLKKPRKLTVLAAAVIGWLGTATSFLGAEPATEFLASKYGFLVTCVWSGDLTKPYSIDARGRIPQTFDEFANAFDAEGLADDLAKWGVEYIIFSAWHYNINPLFPSETMKRWGMADHTCQRDVIREVITACKGKNIKVMLYTHPRDGHDLSVENQLKTGWGGPNGHDPQWAHYDRLKWNHFTAELYQELITRYGGDLMGLMIDEGSVKGDSDRVVDYPRLRRLLKAQQPGLILQQNFFGNLYSLDLGAKEFDRLTQQKANPVTHWPAWRMPVMINFTSSWWSTQPIGKHAPSYCAEDMFRYTILQAGCNHEGGGVQWAAGNYVGGGWEDGVFETMQQLGNLMRPIAPAIKNTLASTAFPTLGGETLADLKWGVATRATDDSVEYLHVLKPPPEGSKILKLPLPADGKRFEKAWLLADQTALGFQQTSDGIQLTLPPTVSWNPVDTVIVLPVAPHSPLQNIAIWKAFQSSSVPDPIKATKTRAFSAAVDGDLKTAWSSRANGAALLHDEAAPADPQPWCLVDLGHLARLSRIEIMGDLGPNLAISVSPTAHFSASEVVGRRPESKADQPWILDLPTQPRARYLRLARTSNGPPLTVTECRVFGQFQ